MKRNAVVIGAGGYSGAELAGILSAHPQVAIAGLFASADRGKGDGPVRFADLFPRWRGLVDAEVRPTDVAAVLACKPEVVFLATPNEVSHELAPQFLKAGVVVIDVSGAFRLKDAAMHQKHYGFEHTRPDLLKAAAYGLPEINRAAIANAGLIACAGCYPTSAIIPLHALKAAGAIEPSRRPIIDATSGVSGAGRGLALKSLFCEVSLQPYNVFKHRHNPEIDAFSGVKTVFTPHLGAFDRGILSTIHVDLAKGWTGTRVTDLFLDAYGKSPFVRLLPSGQWPSVQAVRETNFCDIGWAVDEEASHLIVASALDNLVKGAAGQAVQCMNIRLGLPETAGLTGTPRS